MANRELQLKAVAVVGLLAATGLWAMFGMNDHPGVKQASAYNGPAEGQAGGPADGQAGGQSGHVRKAIKAPITSPLEEPSAAQNADSNVPADKIPEDLRPTGLTINRSGKLQDVNVQPPQRYQVTDASLAAALYKTLLALEYVPRTDIFFCPMDFGISYDLRLTDDRQDVLHIKADAAGCRFIHLDDGTAFRQDDAFTQAMMDATGMTEAQLRGEPGAFK